MAARAPAATLTFLFSDIEGSTRTLDTLGSEAYTTVLERHAAIMRAAIANHGGREQGTEGDSFFVVFDNALDAVAAAVEAQRALATEPWPPGGEVTVRMGLHAGEASTSAAGLVGIDVNRAARIAAAAHGGQIVVSEAVRALVTPDLGEAISLRGLGNHRLKDLREPQPLCQVVADGLRMEFPPLKSLDARPNNLPTQLTSFVGREKELAEAGDLLARNRLVTLTGPGGTGKTRLSLQVAANAAERFTDGVFFVPLETVREPAPRGLADRFGHRARGDGIAERRHGPPRMARRQAGPARPRQLRAGHRRGPGHRRAAPRRARPVCVGDLAGGAPRLRRAGVPGPWAANAAGLLEPVCDRDREPPGG